MTDPGIPETGHFSTAGPPDYRALSDRLAKAEAECERLRAALGEPCAECGHIDWREFGVADDE